MRVAFYHRYRPAQEASVLESLLEGGLRTDGAFAQDVRELASRRWGLGHLLPTPSCTHALEAACRLLGLQTGDEVLLPSYNFPSAANAVLLAGGEPVLCDIDPATQTLSLDDLARRITPRTRAVIAVHYAGVSCDLDRLCTLCKSAGIDLVEDAAQGADARYKGKALGSFGRFAAYSFHHTKNFSCGEGGALVCRDGDLRPAEIFREKGTDRSSYLRGEIDRYRWVRMGSSPLLSEPCAALLLAQLQCADEITGRLREVQDTYQEALAPLELHGRLRRMTIPDYALPNGHICYLRFPSQKLRDHAMESLRAAEVECHPHFVPLHLSPMGRSLGYAEADLPESRRAWQTLLRLPIHTGMGEDEVAYIAGILERGSGL